MSEITNNGVNPSGYWTRPNRNNDKPRESSKKVVGVFNNSVKSPIPSKKQLRIHSIKKGFGKLMGRISKAANNANITPRSPKKDAEVDSETQSSDEVGSYESEEPTPRVNSEMKFKKDIAEFADQALWSHGNSPRENRTKFNKILAGMNLSQDQLGQLRKSALEKMSEEGIVEIPKDELARLGIEDLEINILPNGNLLFQKGNPIGQGAENTVWKGVEIRPDKTVWFQNRAVIFNRSMGDYQDPSVKKILENFTSEDHICPPPVTLKVIESSSGSLMKSLTLYQGGDADGLIGDLSFEDALRVSVGTTIGLSKMSTEGLLHRDIKPGNIFVYQDHNSEITADIGDLGEACFVDDVKFLGGTPTYNAPELSVPKARNSKESDLWSLGIVLWQLFYGEKSEDTPMGYYPPFIDELRNQIESEGKTFAIEITDSLGGIKEDAFIHDNLGFSPPKDEAEAMIQKLIQGLLSLDPQARPSMDELLSTLKGVAELKGITIDAPSPRKKDTRIRAPAGPKPRI